jgi:ankyrin repeat protein
MGETLIPKFLLYLHLLNNFPAMKPHKLLNIFLLYLVLFVSFGCNRSPLEGTETQKEKVTPLLAEKPVSDPVSDPVSEEALRQAALDGIITEVNKHLEAGTAVDALDPDGHTALMFAAFNGHSEIVLKLLEEGAELEKRDFMDRTALLYACTGPFPETVKILLDKGALPNVVDSDEHFSPLMHAAAEGNFGVVKILVEFGADLSLKDVDGDDAESFAMQAGHQQVADYLHSIR